MDNIQIDPPPQLIPLVSGLPQRPTPAPQPQPTAPKPPVDPVAAARRKQAQIEKEKEEKRAQRRAKREEREKQRQKIIEQWQPIIDQDRADCLAWLGDNKSSSGSRLTPDQQLGKQISAFWQTTRTPAKQQAQREKVVRTLQEFFDATWPGHQLTVAPFGSSVTGINHSGSDLDLVLLDPSRPLGVGTPPDKVLQIGPEVPHSNGFPEFYNVRKIADRLRRFSSQKDKQNFQNINSITGANVPILKFETSDGIAIDLNINNRFGLLNSHLIRAYADLRPNLFRPLCYAVKHWLKRRGLNDPSGSSGLPSLSSYSIVLLVIQYLQLRGDLPDLQWQDLVEHLELQQEDQYQAAKVPRRRAGDPRPIAGQATEPQAEPYDVTFFDPAVKPSWIKEVTRGNRRCWINTRLYDPKRLPSFEDWDEILREDFSASWGLPEADGVGMHKIDDKDVDAMLGLHFRSFIEWYFALDKRRSIVSICLGRVKRLNTVEDRLAFEEAKKMSEKPVEERDPDFNYTPLLLFDRNQPLEWDSHRIITEDPFIRDRNTSKNIGKQVADGIDAEFARAVKMMQLHSNAKQRKQRQQLADSRNDSDEASPLLFAELCLPLPYSIALETPAYLAPNTKDESDSESIPETANYTGHFRWPNPNPKRRRGRGGRSVRGGRGARRGVGSRPGTGTGTDTTRTGTDSGTDGPRNGGGGGATDGARQQQRSGRPAAAAPASRQGTA